jgi:hypothetical protein
MGGECENWTIGISHTREPIPGGRYTLFGSSNARPHRTKTQICLTRLPHTANCD